MTCAAGNESRISALERNLCVCAGLEPISGFIGADSAGTRYVAAIGDSDCIEDSEGGWFLRPNPDKTKSAADYVATVWCKEEQVRTTAHSARAYAEH
jgi:hypothetical protein